MQVVATVEILIDPKRLPFREELEEVARTARPPAGTLGDDRSPRHYPGSPLPGAPGTPPPGRPGDGRVPVAREHPRREAPDAALPLAVTPPSRRARRPEVPARPEYVMAWRT